MARLFSGIQPTGTLHIGNYVGAIRQWVDLQHEYESFYCVVDLHAMTVPFDPKEMRQNVLNVAATYLACGLDPNKAVIFVQSHIPEHTELMWLLNVITPLGQLERMTQYKEKMEQHKESVFAGLLNYPVLMAADILIYKAVAVPVGEDQKQHVELTRDIAEKFNRQFGETFPLPNYVANEGARIMALNDPAKKMSKSIPGSFVALTDSDEEIRKKVMAAVTDVGIRKTEDGRRKSEMSPGVRNLFTLLKFFSTERIYTDFMNRYEAGELQYADLKARLAEDIIQVLTPIRRRHAELMEEPDKLRAILAAGADTARPIAQKTIREVKEKMGLV
jgi:tryptophanyl-tRNA synthetase